MNDQQLVAEGWGAYSVIAVSFEDDRNAYNALTSLKELDSHQRVGVQEAVVVVRGEDGVEMDRVESMFLPNTAGGGLIGLLIGIIGGPLGMLIGSASGLWLGSPSDLGDIDQNGVGAGRDLEQRPGWADRTAGDCARAESRGDRAAMSDLGGTVLRRSVADVEAEIAAAEDAERKPSRKPARSLPRSDRGHDKAAVDAKLDQLKAKLSRGQKAPA